MAQATRNPGLKSTILKSLLVEALRALGRPRATVSLVLTGDEEIRVLNRDYRDVDRPTDVLSFPLADAAGLADPTRGVFLGEIYVSLDTARRQARAARRPLGREVAHLAVHGLLHLLGHDHATPSGRRRMAGIEGWLLRILHPRVAELSTPRSGR